MALPICVCGQITIKLRERSAGIRHRLGGERLKWNLRQRPDENLVWLRLRFKRLEPLLLFEPRRDSAHGGVADERLMNRICRHSPFFERRQRLRQNQLSIEMKIRIAPD